MRIIKILIRIACVFLMTLLLVSFSAGYVPPSSSKLFSLMGLAFPIIWTLAFASLILLLITRLKWYFIGSILVLLLTLPVMLRHFNISFLKNATPSAYSLFNLNTFGLRYPDSVSNQLTNQELINHYINNGRYTIACFQEYPMKGAKHGKFYENVDNGLNLNYIEMSAYNWDQKYTDYILLTASRYPIVKSEIFKYDSLAFAMYTDINFPEGIIRVYNVHLQSIKLLKEKELLTSDGYNKPKRFFDHIKSAIRKLNVAFLIRENQSLILSESLKDCPYPIIIAGDLNDTPVSYTYRKISRGLKDASKKGYMGFKRTYKLSNIPLQIDYILHSSAIKSHEYKVIDPLISDHYAISSNFNISGKETME
jgi:endonuclease/exonuclease/phosphatase family metal-dependent hydrolase